MRIKNLVLALAFAFCLALAGSAMADDASDASTWDAVVEWVLDALGLDDGPDELGGQPDPAG